MSPFVARVEGQWIMLYSGGPKSGMPGYFRYQIGLATADGPEGPWRRTGAPVLPLGAVDDFHTTPTLLRGEDNQPLKEGGLYHMLYCGNRNDSVYRATSPDGLTWTKNATTLWKGYAPNAIRINGTIWLYSIAKPADGRPWEVALAKGASWDTLEHAGTVLVSNTQPWEDGSLFYPYVLYEGPQAGWTMSWSAYANKAVVKTNWTGGITAIGLAHSHDGVSWDKCATNPVMSPRPGSRYDSVYVGSPCLVVPAPTGSAADAPLLYYGGRVDQQHKYFALAHAVASTARRRRPLAASSPWAWSGPPEIADVLGVDTDAATGGGVAHVTGAGLTAYAEGDPAVGSDVLVEAVGDGGEPPVALPVERRWRDSFLIVSLPPATQSVCRGSGGQPCPYRLRVSNAHGSATSPYVNAPELHWVQPFARPGATVDVFGRRFWGAPYCVLLQQQRQKPDGGAGTAAAATAAGERKDTQPACLPAVVRNENRLSFAVPAGELLGVKTVALRDASGRVWGGATVSSGLCADDTLTVVAPPLQLGVRVNASAPPHALDPTGKTDVTAALYAAVLAATVNGTRPGGTVLVGPGRYLINSTAGCRVGGGSGGSTGGVFTAICELPKRFAATVAGAGAGRTVFEVGSALGSFVQATPLSFRDLTVTDWVPDPRSAAAANQSAAYGSSMIGLDWASAGSRWPRQGGPPAVSPSMLGSGLDWSTSVLMNNSDVTLERVHLVSTRAAATVSFGNTQRLVIRDSVIDGGCVWLSAPLRDLRFTGNLVRNGGLGNGWGGSGMSIRLGSGHFTGLFFENNTFDHLATDLMQSGFSGRMLVGQGMVAERVYFANNTNLRAGPGNLSQQNSGEQLLWETPDEVPLLRGAVASAEGAAVTLASAESLNVNSSDRGWSPLFSFYSRVGGAAAAARGANHAWGYSRANAEYHGYCHVDESTGLCAPNVTIGLVHVVQGRGAGQTRRLCGISSDNRTLTLDRAFAVPPDATSTLSVTGAAMVDFIARDVIIRGGVRAQVASADHTATTAVDVYDSGHRLTYTAFDVSQCRQTVEVNAWRNSTLSDVVVRGVRSDYTRTGIAVRTQGHASDGGVETQWDENQPNVGVSIRGVTLSNVVASRWDAARPQEGHGADSVADGAVTISVACGYSYYAEGLDLQTGTSMMVVEDLSVTNASVAVNFAAPCDESPAARVLAPGRFAALLLRNVDAVGGGVGLVVNDNVSAAAAGVIFYNVSLSRFRFPANVSWDLRYGRPLRLPGLGPAVMQPRLQLLTPLVRAAAAGGGSAASRARRAMGKQWAVEFRNAGLAAGRFSLSQLDPALAASPTSWDVPAGNAVPTRVVVTLKGGGSGGAAVPSVPSGGTACGLLSGPLGDAERFCVEL